MAAQLDPSGQTIFASVDSRFVALFWVVDADFKQTWLEWSSWPYCTLMALAQVGGSRSEMTYVVSCKPGGFARRVEEGRWDGFGGEVTGRQPYEK